MNKKLEDFKKIKRCPNCTVIKFMPLHLPNGELAASNIVLTNTEAALDGTITLFNNSLPSYFKVCTNCGFVGIFSLKMLL